MLTRRTIMTGPLLTFAGFVPARAADRAHALTSGLAAIERRIGGRLGVAILDSARETSIAYRGDERFPLCSTFKCLAVAFVLARCDRGEESLDRRIAVLQGDLLAYAPVTSRHLGGDGMTVAALCEAAITVSDNTAANLLLASFGGPGALTRFLRSIGDGVTRLDRGEPALNDADPGDPRDTTTPLAMIASLHKIVLGTTLSEASRGRLTAWLVASETGHKKIRAGVPSGWRVGDKTGSGGRNATNDVAIIWPLSSTPILVTAYLIASHGSAADRDAALAEIGRLATT